MGLQYCFDNWVCAVFQSCLVILQTDSGEYTCTHAVCVRVRESFISQRFVQPHRRRKDGQHRGLPVLAVVSLTRLLHWDQVGVVE